MRKQCEKALKRISHEHILWLRDVLGLTQSEMAEFLLMDVRSYSDIDHGKALWNVVTFTVYLLYLCPDPEGFLQELKAAFNEIIGPDLYQRFLKIWEEYLKEEQAQQEPALV